MTRLGDVSFATLLNYQSHADVESVQSPICFSLFFNNHQFDLTVFGRVMYLWLIVFVTGGSEGTATGVELQVLHCENCALQLSYLISGVVLQSRVL